MGKRPGPRWADPALRNGLSSAYLAESAPARITSICLPIWSDRGLSHPIRHRRRGDSWTDRRPRSARPNRRISAVLAQFVPGHGVLKNAADGQQQVLGCGAGAHLGGQGLEPRAGDDGLEQRQMLQRRLIAGGQGAEQTAGGRARPPGRRPRPPRPGASCPRSGRLRTVRPCPGSWRRRRRWTCPRPWRCRGWWRARSPALRTASGRRPETFAVCGSWRPGGGSSGGSTARVATVSVMKSGFYSTLSLGRRRRARRRLEVKIAARCRDGQALSRPIGAEIAMSRLHHGTMTENGSARRR